MFEFKKTSHLHRRRTLIRAWVAGIVAVVFLSLLGGRLWYLQVARYEGLAARADRNRIAVVPIAPRRGEVTDREGVVLARNYRDYTLNVVPAQVEGSIDDLLDSLSELVYLSPRDRRRFKQALGQNSRYSEVLLRNSLNEVEASWFAAHSFKYPGVSLQARWVREYPQGEAAAHVIGYVGRISEADEESLEKQELLGNYRGTSIIGKKGVEKTWESTLHGQTGVEEREVTASGRPVRVLSRIDPIPGSDLKLSIDIGLQKLAEEQFAGRRGALVAIEPKTGRFWPLSLLRPSIPIYLSTVLTSRTGASSTSRPIIP